MRIKIFGISLGIIAIISTVSSFVKSSEEFKAVSIEAESSLGIEKIKQIHSQRNSTQQPPLIDRKLFFGNPEISGAQLSPDGKFISFIKPLNGILNIWVKGIEEPMSAGRPITQSKTRPILNYFWSNDSKYILFSQDKGGDENYHIYAVSPTAKTAPGSLVPNARDLTPYQNLRARIIAVPKSNPNIIIVGLNDRDPRSHDVYRLNISTGKRELIFKNDRKVAGWLTDLKGNLRLGITSQSDGGTEIVRVDGNKITPIYSCNFLESCTLIQFHKDNKRVYIATNKGDDVDLTRLVLLDTQTKKIEKVESDPKEEVDIDGVFFSHEDELGATYYLGDHKRIYPKNQEFASTLAFLEQALPKGDLKFTSVSNNGQLMLVAVTSDIDPGSVYIYNKNRKKITKLYSFKSKLNRKYLAPMYPIRYKARDGLSIPAYLTLPKGIPPHNLPVVLYVHGGPWSRDSWEYDTNVQLLANRGYAVLQPNFRGSSGYGKAFLNAGNREWGRAMQHDLADGVKYLIEQKIADPKRVAIFGVSYGGYASLAGLTFDSELYAVGVSYVGISNLVTFLNSIPPYWESGRALAKLRVGEIETVQGRALMRSRSPLFSAHKIKAPLMVIQGANDPRVKQAESDQIVAAVRDNNKQVEYLLAPDEGHGFRKEINRLAVAAAMERFFARHLQGRYQESISPKVKKKLDELTVDINTVKTPKSNINGK